jgi:hypothetical protein
MHETLSFPILLPIEVLGQNMQKPFIFWPMWLCEFEELAETIFVTNPEISHGTLLYKFQFPTRVGINA